MKNPLLGELPEIEIDGKTWIDSQKCRALWEKSGRDWTFLGQFVRKYPAALRLNWLTAEIGKAGILGGAGEYSKAAGDKQGKLLATCYWNFRIFETVQHYHGAGYPITVGNQSDVTAFSMASKNHSFGGAHFEPGRIKNRYYDFLNHEPARFADAEERALVCGPARFDLNGLTQYGVWKMAF